jgi:5'-3' exonuclease
MSSDQDFLQLVNNKITVYSPTKKKMYTSERIREEYGVTPQNYLQMKILLGDSSDNVPGVPKLGPKKLIKNFPELQEDATVTLKDVLEKSQNSKGTMYEAINMFSHQLKINEKLMDLHNPNIPEEDVARLDFLIANPTISYTPEKFVGLYKEDLLGKTLLNPQMWLNETFTKLLQYKLKD